MEAEKLKKKLNGSILKGKKVKIEEARPQKRRRVEESDETPLNGESRVKTKKKSKKDPNVIEGHELPLDRKVKRGWTEAKTFKPGKKDKAKTSSVASKFSDKDELLFRTKVPANKADLAGSKSKEKAKSKTQKIRAHVVHEFETSTAQPSFLRENIGLGIRGNLHYVEGQGWTDETGTVVEGESERVSKRRMADKSPIQSIRKARGKAQLATGAPVSTDTEEVVDELPNAERDDETSTSGSSSGPGSEEHEQIQYSEADATHEATSSTSEPDSNEPSGIHPLEALFKKPQKPVSQDVAKPSLEIATSFSFFESGNTDDIEDEPAVPGTPFSSQDLRSRGLRSAAPTPDTAHPSRFNSYGSTGMPGDEDVEDEEEELASSGDARLRKSTKSVAGASETVPRTQSEFEKKFWENRGENNRAWKLRRRTVLKEKRQRENKARRPRNW